MNGPAATGFVKNDVRLAFSAVGDPIVLRFLATVWSKIGSAVLSPTFSVSGSVTSMVATLAIALPNGDLFAGSAMRPQLYFTASASYAVPSENFTPERIFKIQVSPLSAVVRLCATF